MSLNVDQATSSTVTSGSDATVAVARPTRKQITFLNLDGTNAVYLNVGAAATSSHFTLSAGKQVTFVATGAWHMTAAAATPAVAIVDEYD